MGRAEDMGKNKNKKLQPLLIPSPFRKLEVLCPSELFRGEKFTVGCISARDLLVFTGIEESFGVGVALILTGSSNTPELRVAKRSCCS